MVVVDAFNPLSGWYDTDVIGINTGITMLMSENERTGLVWKVLMSNPDAQSAFQAVQLKWISSVLSCPTRSPQNGSGLGACQLAVFVFQLAIHENVLHAL